MKSLYLIIIAIALALTITHDIFAGPAAQTLKPAVKYGEKTLGKATKPFLTKGSKQCMGGDSTKLAKAIGIVPKNGYQAHHIIPMECKTHPVLNKIGFDLDQAANGIALPSRPGLSDLPLHRGYHSSYSAAVRRDLDAIPMNLSESATISRVNNVISKYKNMIKSGKSLYDEGAPDAWR